MSRRAQVVAFTCLALALAAVAGAQAAARDYPTIDVTFNSNETISASLNGVPIVAFTASAIKGDEDIARASGCDGYVTKPIDTRTLGNQVREFLNQARPARTYAS